MTALNISGFFIKYLAAWISFCLIAVAVLVKDRNRLKTEWREYWRFLCVPWKLYTFAPAFLFVAFAGRYTDDETWDLVTGSGMSMLTFLTAPWSVGLIYQVTSGRRPLRYLIVALALALFSSSWFYDAYLLWRDGAYTVRWEGNLILSPFVYVAAGMLWNLEARADSRYAEGGKVRFSFIVPDWPRRPADTRFAPLVLATIPPILIAAFVLVGFVGWHFNKFQP
jgi:hypothetical protein